MHFLIVNQNPANQRHHTKRHLNQNRFCFEYIRLE